jgi:hypothetical protein
MRIFILLHKTKEDEDRYHNRITGFVAKSAESINNTKSTGAGTGRNSSA